MEAAVAADPACSVLVGPVATRGMLARVPRAIAAGVAVVRPATTVATDRRAWPTSCGGSDAQGSPHRMCSVCRGRADGVLAREAIASAPTFELHPGANRIVHTG